MKHHILNIRVLFPQCGWSCGSSSVLIDQMTYHILSKCGSSLHYGRACAFSESQPHQMTCCIGHNCMLFLCCEWLCASSDLLLDWMIEHLCILPPLMATYVSQFWFVLFRSGTFNTVAFDKLEALYFKDLFLIFWKRSNSKTIILDRIFYHRCLCLRIQIFMWHLCIQGGGGGAFSSFEHGRSFIPIVEVWCNK